MFSFVYVSTELENFDIESAYVIAYVEENFIALYIIVMMTKTNKNGA